MNGKKEQSSTENRIRQNLLNLIKLQFLQRRFLYLGLMLLEFGCMIFGIVANLRERIGYGGGIHIADMSGMLQFGILLVVLNLCLGSYNAADNKQISMYPGTRTTRYLSRIILDILFLFCFTVWLVVLYLMSYGVYNVAYRILPDVNLLYFFSWKYLFEGSIWIFALFIMMYGLVQLAYIVMYFLGRNGYLIVWGFGLFVCILFAGMLAPVYQLLHKPLSWKEAVEIYFMAGIISIFIISFIVLRRKRPPRMVYGPVVLLVATALIFELGLKLAIDYQNLEGAYNTLEYDIIEEAKEESEEKRIFKEFEISWGEGDRMKFLEELGWVFSEKADEEDYTANCLVPQTEIISVSDMKYRKEASFDETRVTKDTFVLRLEAIDGTYQEKPIYQEIMDQIVLKKKNNRLYYDCKSFYYVLNLMFGRVNKFADTAEYNIWDLGEYDSVSEGMYLKAIIDEETMKEWEQVTEVIM